MNSTITFSTTTPNTTTAHAARHSNRYRGPAQFRSLDFSERNGYLKDPARFCSLDFGERNGYLKGVAPIDAQQKSLELRTFSCSRGSSSAGTLPTWHGTLHQHDPRQLPL